MTSEESIKYFKVIGEGFKTRDEFDWMPFLKGEWVEEKDCEKSDKVCGKGLHVWENYPRYSLVRYLEDHTFEVECEGLLGQDGEKARFRKVRMLRLVPKFEIFKPKANLRNSKLYRENRNLLKDNLDSLSPTEVYLYMLSKMAGAPLHIYAEISVRLIMPILSEKLSSIPDSQGVNGVVKKE